MAFFAERPIAKITADDIERFMAAKRGEGRSPKSVRNYLGVLHSLLTYAEKCDWIASNPCRKVDFPRIADGDPDIRFLSPEGVEALLRAVQLEHEWGPPSMCSTRPRRRAGPAPDLQDAGD